jgi:hypothetical protein
VLARNVEDGDETIAVLDEYYMGLMRTISFAEVVAYLGNKGID